MTHLDTHVVVWLYAGRADLLPTTAREAIESDELGVSPMVELELHYLAEIGRLRGDAGLIVPSLQAALGLRVSELPFRAVIVEALGITWTRDPFDRLLVAQARAARARLLTRDQIIRRQFAAAFWD